MTDLETPPGWVEELCLRHAREQVYLDRAGNETADIDEAARFGSALEAALFLDRIAPAVGQWISDDVPWPFRKTRAFGGGVLR